MFEPLAGILDIMRDPKFWLAMICVNAVFGFIVIAITKARGRW